jgi:type IV pilus assembly protein PilO
MTKFTEMSKMAQLGLICGLVVAVTMALYILVFKPMDDQNNADRLKLLAKQKDIEMLRPFERNLPELDRQIESLKEQMEIQRRIVPDEKEADQFMHIMQDTASSAGIEIRRYVAKPTATREFYVEVPFEVELDGPYYSMLRFFEKVSRLERIINVSNLQLAGLKGGGGSYQYAPGESVSGTCTTTTFFSHDPSQPAAPAAAKK